MASSQALQGDAAGLRHLLGGLRERLLQGSLVGDDRAVGRPPSAATSGRSSFPPFMFTSPGYSFVFGEVHRGA
ncbi:MAG: hypothetical protein AVDCRST_MAG22-3358 [uncultured Rubrobacteraceae bacterium]|uniref:Uncharacterized protein n=1 Tax=uncultured Rubrobacteraceae bacterium TaxID=349277 RepID=A0A6J4Q1L1_9ACTN|nr:MAG: hypothetical protein AVDCRST_MAG22-3358 [uncultured Rubrobacteraceae bacterium]